MKTYVAYYGKNYRMGGLLAVVNWAGQEATKRKVEVVIVRCRAGARKGQLILTISPEGLVSQVRGRTVNLKGLPLE